jgi:phosphohistidine phosphatase SixA
MQLVLMRHGQAQPKHPDVDDANRSLTRHGYREAARTANILRDRDVVPTVIWTSPYLRAMQTAQVLAKMTAPAPKWRGLVAAPAPPTAAPMNRAAAPVPAPPAAPPIVEPVAVEELTHEREHWKGKKGRANLDAIIAKLGALPKDSTVAIVGHHHLLQALAWRLTGREVPYMPPASAMLLDDGTGDVMAYRDLIDPRHV